MPTELNSRRIAKNTILLYLRMFITIVIALITSRVVLNSLGVSDFGTYNIVGSVVVLFSFISTPLTSSLQRFLNVSMGEDDAEKVKATFNSSFVAILLVIGVVVLLTETIGLWALNNKLNIPIERFDAARIVFQISILTFCFNIIRSPFEATILAHEKMDVYAYFSIGESVTKLVFVYFLASATFDKLLFYAAGLCFIGLLVASSFALYCRLNFSIARLSSKYFDKNIFKQVLSFSAWSTFGSFVYSGLTSGFDLIINAFFGVIVNAAVGIKNTVVSAVYSFVANFQTAFKPQLFQLYGANKKDEFFRLIFFSSKLSCFLYFFLLFPLFPVVPIVLQLWLGQIPEYTVDFIRLGLLFNLIGACDGPLWMCVYATGKIKRYQIIINLIELCNIPLVIALCYLGMPPQGVFVTRIAVELVVYFVRWWYLKKYIDFPLRDYYNKVFVNILKVLVPMLAISYFLCKLPSNFIYTTLVIISQFLITFLAVYFVGLNQEERSKCKEMAVSFYRNKTHGSNE